MGKPAIPTTRDQADSEILNNGKTLNKMLSGALLFCPDLTSEKFNERERSAYMSIIQHNVEKLKYFQHFAWAWVPKNKVLPDVSEPDMGFPANTAILEKYAREGRYVQYTEEAPTEHLKILKSITADRYANWTDYEKERSAIIEEYTRAKSEYGLYIPRQFQTAFHRGKLCNFQSLHSLICSYKEVDVEHKSAKEVMQDFKQILCSKKPMKWKLWKFRDLMEGIFLSSD